MAIEEHRDARLEHSDRRLVDLLTSALVDPNLHTDTRMRLHEEISEILHAAHADLRPPQHHADRTHVSPAPARPLPDLLARVLVDPNLHTDTRMRLHQQIAEILASVHASQQPRGA